MLPPFVILNGRLDNDWITEFEAYRFTEDEAANFVMETLPAMMDALGGGIAEDSGANSDSPAGRKFVKIVPPPQRSVGHILTIIRQDLWLNRFFKQIDGDGMWVFEVPLPVAK